MATQNPNLVALNSHCSTVGTFCGYDLWTLNRIQGFLKNRNFSNFQKLSTETFTETVDKQSCS